MIIEKNLTFFPVKIFLSSNQEKKSQQSLLSIIIILICVSYDDSFRAKVVDEMGNPIAGANIELVGTDIGTSTDLEICNILNDLDSEDIVTFKNDSLDVVSIFNNLIADTAAFLVLSNKNSWKISIDTMGYFILFAPQEADSYFVALDASIELQLFSSNGTQIEANNSKVSLANIAGCSDIRTRHAYDGLSGAYLVKVFNPNVSSFHVVLLNTSLPPSSNFSVNLNTVFVGDTITFVNQSQVGSYPLLTYAWNFGDNTIKNDSSIVMHAYADTGYFSPSLTVSDGYLFNTTTKNNHIRVIAGEN